MSYIKQIFGMNGAVVTIEQKIARLSTGYNLTKVYIMKNYLKTSGQKHKLIYINLNRLLVLILTISGLAMDGLQYSDLLFSTASLLWLWMPSFISVEMHWLH